ncbi:MAG: glycosyltransferase family 9 protein [Pyrinomonadaceae bacterium]|nr:glycosyltransferase family 9 protein [Pyrinomonadaceae bacterium]
MRVLIVKLGSIGDIVHTLPALAAIKRALPHSEISWVVERRAAEVLRDNPMLDHLIEVDTKALRRAPLFRDMLQALREQRHRLRASKFEFALDFQGLLKSAAIALLSGARGRYGFSREALREPISRLLLTKTFPVPINVHVIAKNLALVRSALDIETPTESSEFEFPIAVGAEHEHEAEQAVEGFGEDFAILNPGGGWPTKLWNAERYGALADGLWTDHHLCSIVTYGPGEHRLAERVVSASRSGRARATSLSLKGFYALAQRTRVYIGGDTGPTHLAVAAGAPIVGLFGPTEWWRNGSPHTIDICVERTDIDCRTNCHRRACSQWVCMDIDVGHVLCAVEERLRRVQRTTELEKLVNA